MSTIDQNPALQLDALQAAGVERLYTDRASGLIARRPELQRALDALRQGDTLVCWRLDRLGRSVAHLLRLAEELRNRGVELRSLTEGSDTRTPAGEAYMTIIAAMAQMERRLLSERTKAGGPAAQGALGPGRLLRQPGKRPGREQPAAGGEPDAIRDRAAARDQHRHAVPALSGRAAGSAARRGGGRRVKLAAAH